MLKCQSLAYYQQRQKRNFSPILQNTFVLVQLTTLNLLTTKTCLTYKKLFFQIKKLFLINPTWWLLLKYICLWQWIKISNSVCELWDFPCGTVVKNLPANAGDTRDSGFIPGSGRSPGVGNGNPLQCSCLKNSMDRGAWWATVHGNHKRAGFDWVSTHAYELYGNKVLLS